MKIILMLISILSMNSLTTGQTGIFYPFGSDAGDVNNIGIEDENSTYVGLLSPFVFFGRMYHQIYINSNGHLTFNNPSSVFIPNSLPSNGSEDVIAALWTDIDISQNGNISYQEYTTGSVLTQATQDINQYFPDLSFTATCVFVVTWDKVAYFYHTGTETSFQVVLISDGNLSFLLINYGDIAVSPNLVQGGYDTINSTHYFLIPESNNGSSISNLKYSSNVNVPGRWVFRVDGKADQNRETVIGLQMRVISYSDLAEIENIAYVMEKIKQELVHQGLPSNVELNLRRVEKIKP
ncbi:sushi, nidogen and EGF-like domain-containing protein 1 [Paramisgurnus dabryanus]|uniref:sushi, nidogen and EGF-like domain-containing protein 1 n=1 Tax=Paramisgurnus dabryanus TaxID=90735 RepID=UPI0031F3B1B8